MDQPESLSELTLAAIETALFAGEILREGFGTHYSIQSKEGVHNLVTEYDHRSEKKIIELLLAKFPSSKFLAEESGATGKHSSDILWIVDPLDGTVNFAHNIPFFSVSIAAQKEGQIILGVIFQPMTHELFIVERGQGAYLNGCRLKVSSTHELKKAFLATGFPYNLADNPLHCIEHFTDILRLGIPIRRLGAATLDLAYTAAGRFDAFFEVSLAPWDVAAGLLLIEEAGGRISHWNGSDYDPFSHESIAASNGLIHDNLLAVLKKHP